MSAKAAAAKADEAGATPAKGKKKLLIIVAGLLLLLGGGGAGLWFTGILPEMLGAQAPEVKLAEKPPEAPRPAPPVPPSFLDMPDIITNLNVSGRRPSFIKLRSKLELGRAEDAGPLQAAMPKLLDLFQTYLREIRPEELRGSAGTYRLREELMARANLAAPPAKVKDILFIEMIVQ